MDDNAHALLLLVTRVLQAESLNRLTERYDLGYYLDIGWHISGGMAWLSFSLQSSHDLAYVEQCVEAYLEDVRGLFGQMKSETFAALKASTIEQISGKGKQSFHDEVCSLYRAMKTASEELDPFAKGES